MILRRFAAPVVIVGVLLIVGSAALVVAGTRPQEAKPPAAQVLPQQSDPEVEVSPVLVEKPPTATPPVKVGESASVEVGGFAGNELETGSKSAPKDSGGGAGQGRRDHWRAVAIPGAG